MPHSIPPGLTRKHVLRAIADLDASIPHPFGAPTKYELVHEGRRYAPNAVIGLACRYSIGRVLTPHDFSGGEAPGQTNYVLRKLGFSVVAKGDDPPAEETPGQDKVGSNWTSDEVRLLVADYFDMLTAEIAGKTYKKADHRKALAPLLGGRSEGSIEFKHQNVSGVLVERGMPYIEGYKPRTNYQGLLAAEVDAYLDRHSEFLAELSDSPTLNPTQAPHLDPEQLDQLVEDPPEKIITPAAADKPWLSRKGRRINFAERDAANRKLGQLGEQFVFEYERHRLMLYGRDDLARRVEWASQTIGDGLGFDLISFDHTDDSERLLEVKTTGLGKFGPFYVTGNEVHCSEDVPDQFQLVRLFDFGRRPRMYLLHGSIRTLCQLEPVIYRASIERV